MQIVETLLPTGAEIGVQAFKIVPRVCKLHAGRDISEIECPSTQIRIREDGATFVFHVHSHAFEHVECCFHATAVATCGNRHLLPARKDSQLATITRRILCATFGQGQVASERRVVRRKRRPFGMPHEDCDAGSAAQFVGDMPKRDFRGLMH